MADTPSPAAVGSGRRGLNPDLLKLALGIAIVAGTLWGQQAFGFLTRESRIDPKVPRAGLVDVVAVVGFEPERFHNERLATYGMFSGRDGSLKRIRLRQVSQDQLVGLASLPWIDKVEPLR
jgi:hypothetical protein